jgi:hypothetical protein
MMKSAKSSFMILLTASLLILLSTVVLLCIRIHSPFTNRLVQVSIINYQLSTPNSSDGTILLSESTPVSLLGRTASITAYSHPGAFRW